MGKDDILKNLEQTPFKCPFCKSKEMTRWEGSARFVIDGKDRKLEGSMYRCTMCNAVVPISKD